MGLLAHVQGFDDKRRKFAKQLQTHPQNTVIQLGYKNREFSLTNADHIYYIQQYRITKAKKAMTKRSTHYPLKERAAVYARHIR